MPEFLSPTMKTTELSAFVDYDLRFFFPRKRKTVKITKRSPAKIKYIINKHVKTKIILHYKKFISHLYPTKRLNATIMSPIE